jgi:hypothetical protein
MFFGADAAGKNSNKGQNFGEDVEGYIMGRSSNTSNNSYEEYREAA